MGGVTVSAEDVFYTVLPNANSIYFNTQRQLMLYTVPQSTAAAVAALEKKLLALQSSAYKPVIASLSETAVVTALNNDGVTVSTVPPPNGLAYPRESYRLIRTESIEVSPTRVEGFAPFSFSVAPALPAGLEQADGKILGTPTTLQRSTEYTVTATNVVGSTSTKITFLVTSQADENLVFDLVVEDAGPWTMMRIQCLPKSTLSRPRFCCLVCHVSTSHVSPYQARSS